MPEYDLKRRTKQFALDVLRLCEQMPTGRIPDLVVRQLARASASVGANYRAACRPRSDADFIAKLCIVEEETDESVYWLEIIQAKKLANADAVAALLDEGQQLLAIIVASIRTAKRNRAERRRKKQR
jgi:four helix bundle protein